MRKSAYSLNDASAFSVRLTSFRVSQAGKCKDCGYFYTWFSCCLLHAGIAWRVSLNAIAPHWSSASVTA
jgi:hypothetical protein